MANASNLVGDAKSSVASTLTTNTQQQQQQQHQLPQRKISQVAPAKNTGDTMMDYEVDDDVDVVMSVTLPEAQAMGKRWSCSNPILTFLEELLAPGLLLSPTFICLLLSNVFTMWGACKKNTLAVALVSSILLTCPRVCVVGLVIPYFMLPDLVAENNWTQHEAGSILSYIGFANTIGRCIASEAATPALI